MGEKKLGLKRVVLDTNIFVSALLFEGKTAEIVDLWKQGKIIPLVSGEMLKEIISVLAYPKFALDEREINSILNEDILPYIETVTLTRQIKGICSDPDDDMFLSCAVNGRADAIISGDIHLLNVKEVEGIPVFKVARLMQSL